MCISERGVRRTTHHRWSRGVAGGVGDCRRRDMTRLQVNFGGGGGCNTKRNRGRVGGSSSRTTRLQVNLTGGGGESQLSKQGTQSFSLRELQYVVGLERCIFLGMLLLGQGLSRSSSSPCDTQPHVRELSRHAPLIRQRWTRVDI